MTPEEIVALVDFRYLTDALTPGRGAGAPDRAAGRDPGGARGRAAARRLPGLHDLGRLAGLRRRQDPAPLPRGAGRRLDAVQAEGRRRPRRRPPPGGDHPRGDRTGPDARGRRQPALGRRRGHRLDGAPGAVRPVLDRGADEPGRHPRPRGDRPGGRADPGRDRRARPQPGDVQAAPPGRGDRRSARSTPAGSAASTRSSRSCCSRRSSACRSARTPAASGCASWSSTCRPSTTSRSAGARRPDDRVRRPPPRALPRSGRGPRRRYRLPTRPGYSARDAAGVAGPLPLPGRESGASSVG